MEHDIIVTTLRLTPWWRRPRYAWWLNCTCGIAAGGKTLPMGVFTRKVTHPVMLELINIHAHHISGGSL